MLFYYLCAWIIALNAGHSSAVPVYATKEALVIDIANCLAASPIGACTPDIGTWDVSAITDMAGLFADNVLFNADISGSVFIFFLLYNVK